MKGILLILVFCVTAFSGCAGSQIQADVLRTFLAKRLVVSLPEEVPFPNQMTLVLSGVAGQSAALGNQMMESFGTSSLEQKIGEAVKNSGVSLRRQTSELFARELRATELFAGVTNSEGDAMMAIRVSRWGLAWDDASSRYEPIFDIEASLSVAPVGVIWRSQRNVRDISTSVRSAIFDLDPNLLAVRPQKLTQALNLVTEDLSRQMAEELRGKSQPR